MKFKIEFSAASDMGKSRKNNEDSFLLAPELELAIVADGMGGHNSGEVASSLAVKVTRDRYESMRQTGVKPNPYNDKASLEANQLGFAVQLANSVIYEAGTAGPENKGMGTTLSAGILNGTKISIAHIGDSRIYLLRGKAMQQLTEDHSLVMEHFKKGLLTKEQMEASPLQNILTRALGTQKTPAVDLVETELEENDRLLFCSDGLFKAVKEDTIRQMILAQPDNAKACAEMIEAANAAGGPDNVTVIVGTVKKKSFKENIKDMFKKSYA